MLSADDLNHIKGYRYQVYICMYICTCIHVYMYIYESVYSVVNCRRPQPHQDLPL